mgnify:CR=1 FL=1|jgi:hypothetical protein
MSTDRGIAMARLDIAATAQAMLDGGLSFIEGGRRIAELRFYADLPEDDQDAMAFVLIDSETDTLPFGETKALWNPEALAKLQPEIERSERWAREISQEPCRRLIERFGPNDAVEVPSEPDFWVRLGLLMNVRLRASLDNNRRFLWIDGFVPDTLLPKLDDGKVLVWAYVSEDSGKSFVEYRVCLHLSAEAVERYREGRWSALLPRADSDRWFALDRAAREIDVLLG